MANPGIKTLALLDFVVFETHVPFATALYPVPHAVQLEALEQVLQLLGQAVHPCVVGR